MSTNSSQLTTEPTWKQEVNRRLAAHKSRKGLSVAPPEPAANRAGVTSRAAQAAAAVAARYAKAPSYSQMQAEEARTAVRAAEIATQVALQAQANAHAVLADMHAAVVLDEEFGPIPPARVSASHIAVQVLELREDRPWPQVAKPVSIVAESAPVAESALEPIPSPFGEAFFSAPDHSEALEEQPELIPEFIVRQALGVRWEPDMPASPAEQGSARAAQWVENRQETFDISPQDWWEPASAQMHAPIVEAIEPVEPELPIHANLIQFPRELVATRKVRPRLAETLAGAASPVPGQLSIFEVDPCAISTEPEQPVTSEIIAGPEWAGIKLDAPAMASDDLDLGPDVEPSRPANTLYQAPLSRRLLAALVDGSLIAGGFVAFAAFAVSRVDQLPGLRMVETFAAAGLVLTGILYLTIFTLLAESTPGMSYAGTSLCTFDDQIPTLAQRSGRLFGLLLSVLPLGLGVAWSLFDEDRMSWHDRLSRTYQRKR